MARGTSQNPVFELIMGIVLDTKCAAGFNPPEKAEDKTTPNEFFLFRLSVYSISSVVE
jgi:hypothetical protein